MRPEQEARFTLVNASSRDLGFLPLVALSRALADYDPSVGVLKPSLHGLAARTSRGIGSPR